MYERVYMVVPLIGKGTPADPKRPMFAPTPAEMAKAGSRTGIIAWHHELSDDGKWALVEFVAADKAGLAPFVAQANAVKATQGVQLFLRETHTQAQMETAFRAIRKNFDLQKFFVRVQ